MRSFFLTDGSIVGNFYLFEEIGKNSRKAILGAGAERKLPEMTRLQTEKDFRKVKKLPFCYLCGQQFTGKDIINSDHVPPKTAFNARDRTAPLKLPTHESCNGAQSVDDKKVGQLIALRRGERPSSRRDQALELVHYERLGMVALENLDVDSAVWRWVRGFHAALYQQPLVDWKHAIQTPFPRADSRGGQFALRPLRPQHLAFVETIKRNRQFGDLDQILANAGKLRYECVWCQLDDNASWFCVFGLDIYDWKDLGGHTSNIPARGCAGAYVLADKTVPPGAATNRDGIVTALNRDTLDPFAP